MIVVGVLENRPYKITTYLDKVIRQNNIDGIKLINADEIHSDIAVISACNKINLSHVPSVIIINSDFDLSRKGEIQLNSPAVIIDCGISLKSSITASSITEEELNFCIQRSFLTLDKIEITPQEFMVRSRENGENNIFNLLACITVLLLSGVSIDEVKKYEF